jgi:K+-sensing histidine kinase KdpD
MKEYARIVTPKLSPGVELHVSGDDCKVQADEQLLRLVTMQFLENAAKHTHTGIITLTYHVEDEQLYVEVKDTGTGVPNALAPNIFSLLADKATYVQDEVPGLGLTICKSLIDHCKGQIGMTTPPTGGALFWYSIPVKTIK